MLSSIIRMPRAFLITAARNRESAAMAHGPGSGLEVFRVIPKNVILSSTPSFLMPYWKRLEASPLGLRLAQGFFWSLVGTILSRALSILSSILVARMLGTVGMGELGIVQSTVGIFGAFAGLGMGVTATTYVAQFRSGDPERAGAILHLSALVTWISGALMTLVMLALAPWFAQHTLAAPHLTGIIRTGSLLLLLGAINGAQTGALAGLEAFKTIARLNVMIALLTFPLMVSGAAWYGLTGAVCGLVGSLAANCLLSHLALRREAAAAGIPITDKLQPEDWAILWRFSMPSVLCGVVFGPANWACSALLVNRPDGYAEMGIYNVTQSWFNAVVFLPGVLAQVILPLLSSHAADAGKHSSRRLVSLAIKANAIAVIPVVLLIWAASPLIMGFYGAGFRSGWPVMAVAVATAGILAIQLPPVQALTAAGHMWGVFFTYVTYGLAFVALTYTLADWGALGMATARCLAYVVNAIWVFSFASRLLWTESITGPAQTMAPISE